MDDPYHKTLGPPTISDPVGLTNVSTTLSPIIQNLSADNTTFPPKLYAYPDIISEWSVRLVMIIVHVVFSLLAIGGNALVIIVICKRKKLRKNPTILFILNLAFSDLVSCLAYRPLILLELCLPFSQSFKFKYPAYHLEQCKFASFFQGLFAAAGFLTMVAISQERLLLIVYPLKAKKMCSAGNVKKVLLFIWIFSTCTVLPIPIRYSQIKTLNLQGTMVSLCGSFGDTLDAALYFIFIFIFYFAVPLVVLSVSYIKIFYVLYQRPKRLDVNQDAGGGKSMRVRRSLAKMMLSVSIIFALCWGPDFVYFLYLSVGGAVHSNGFFIAALVEFLPIISSGVNPCLYTLNSRTFRLAIKSLLLKRRSIDEHYVNGHSFHHSQSPYRSSIYSCNTPSLSYATFSAGSPPSLRRHTETPLRTTIARNIYRRQMSCPVESQDKVKSLTNGSVEKPAGRRSKGILRRSDPITEEPPTEPKDSVNVDSTKRNSQNSWSVSPNPSPRPTVKHKSFTFDHPDEHRKHIVCYTPNEKKPGKLKTFRKVFKRNTELVGFRQRRDSFV